LINSGFSTVFHAAHGPPGWKALAGWYRIVALTVPESVLGAAVERNA